ncbi:FxsB family cyclophane-forming radical SAM/SPASM peptide maturase [Streptomyces sp. MBT33]|uniref:FxsB family cyclophane-forming radical SAM/SPASM peptide maturase n=1 Tax=Streptomyces sp. MBT33 TaxID=1488363 RepID=UPI0027DE45AE|nr:FxsB family cyclophane-forming radical SAM/SPASM peptide maturase [Streptomyces sp. MBT33]
MLGETRGREHEAAAAYYEDSPKLPSRGRASRTHLEDGETFRQFVLKVHSRCNLACTYCYVYRGEDSSWRERPHSVSNEVVRQTARRIGEHATAHRPGALRIDLHGGEPLLTGPELVVHYAETVRRAVPDGTAVTATIQTNGTRLTAATLDRLADAGILVGLSLDGGTAALNRRRVDHAGRPAGHALVRAAHLLAERRPDAYAGVLCTVDPATAPEEVYTTLRALAPPVLDFLLPHLNWGTRPPGKHRPAATPYGDWLARAFDLWWTDTDMKRPAVRLFIEVVALLLGSWSATAAVGLSPVTAVVVETDGTIERVDSLKAAHHGASATGLHVFHDSFDSAIRHPRVAALRAGTAELGDECRSCPVVRVCGGGTYAHRYSPITGHFRHPSVHCPDLERLVRHAAMRIGEQLPFSTKSLV